jgi:DNA-binding response OmpR family regulator
MPKKVLVIDDDRDLVMISTIWVRAAGYDAMMAGGGAAGLAAAETYHPDLILLDIMMPGVDGFQVSRRLKQNPNLAHVPVIFLSAKVQEVARLEAMAAGGRFFLPKPYERDDLIAGVASALSPTESSVA